MRHSSCVSEALDGETARTCICVIRFRNLLRRMCRPRLVPQSFPFLQDARRDVGLAMPNAEYDRGDENSLAG